jgi:hypothetical protein
LAFILPLSILGALTFFQVVPDPPSDEYERSGNHTRPGMSSLAGY